MTQKPGLSSLAVTYLQLVLIVNRPISLWEEWKHQNPKQLVIQALSLGKMQPTLQSFYSWLMFVLDVI